MGSDSFAVATRGLPGPVLYGATGLLVLVLGYALWRARSRSAQFVILAVWMRYMLSAYHHITFQKLFAGLSGNALGSVAMVGLGLLTVRKRHLLQLFFLPCYLMIGLIIISGALNGNLGGLITAATKYAYFLVVAVGLYEALGRDGERQFLPLLLTSFAPLLVLQALSRVLGYEKPHKLGGPISYIGGFSHEATFSIALSSAILVACFARHINPLLRAAFVFACLGGIYLANYRTTILGIAPLALAFFGMPRLTRIYREQRMSIRFATVLVGFVGVSVGAFLLRERFADLSVLLNDPKALMVPPRFFTEAQGDLLSGRVRIWSEYIYAYLDGTDLQHVIGLGPEAWEPVFVAYAHNTLVSYLYEYGWVGVLLLLFFWAWMFAYALRVEGEQRTILIAGHLSFVLLNMATMPLWQIEGNIFYGLLCGYTLYQVRLTEARRALAEGAATPVSPRLAPSARGLGGAGVGRA